MQSQDTNKPNVVSIFAARDKAVNATAEETGENNDAETFEQIMERNQKNKDRVAKERANANKSVLRSYRIKN